MHIVPKNQPDPRAVYCAVGTINYGDVDPDGKPVTLIYLKPAISGDEPCDVFNYARTSTDFPHETTADQWFSESQFESYRVLGRNAPLDISKPSAVDFEQFVANVRNYLAERGPAASPMNGTRAVVALAASLRDGAAEDHEDSHVN